MLQTTSYCQLQTFIIRNRSHKNILNKRGPTIDPCGTPNRISSQELYSEFIFVLSIRSAWEGYYFFSAHSPRRRCRSPAPFTFLRPPAQLLFCGPHVSKFIFHGPELSKLLFHGPVGRKHFLYFCILKVSIFSIEGR